VVSPLDRGEILNHLSRRKHEEKDIYVGWLMDLDMGVRKLQADGS
jgi:hypothetical protein